MSDIKDTKNHVAVLISELKDNLERISVQSEQGFLILGGHLQTATREGKSVNQKVTEIITLAESELGKDVLGKITDLITLAAKYFTDQREDIHIKSKLIKALIDHLARLRGKNSDIGQMAKYLRAVALNIFIETSRSQALSENFSIIAHEIKQLSETILSLSKKVRENVAESEDRFFAIDKEIAKGIHDLETLTNDAKDSFYQAMLETDTWLQSANNIAHKNDSVSKKLIGKVGEIVMALQFQDAMRQRLEHISASLDDMAAMAGGADENEGSSDNSLAMVYELSNMLSHQVEAIIQEAHAVTDQCARSFDNIETFMIDIEDDVKGMMHTHPKKNKETASAQSKTKLTTTLNEFISVKQTGDTLVDRMKVIYNMASEISSTLEEQVGQIHQISMDAHIKALNAIIAATHLGSEGKTLAVLAEEMKSLSDLTDNLVGEIKKILGDLVEGSRFKWSDTGKEGVNDYGKILDDMSNSVPQLINTLIDRFRGLKKDMAQVRNTHERVRESVTFIPGIALDLSTQRDVLFMIRNTLESHRKQGSEGQLIHDQVEQRYTMERERQIHRQSLGHDTGSADMGQGSGAEEELGDNIELF